MATFPIHVIAKCVACSKSDVSLLKPFFILETNLTIDGPRTRVCNGRWATQEEAEAALKEKISK